MPRKRTRKSYDPVVSCRVPKANKRALKAMAKEQGLRSPAALLAQIVINATSNETSVS